MTSLRDRQLDALRQMLNFNKSISGTKITEPTWKILVYDKFGQDILSPILTVKQLRDLGVTLHMLLHSERDFVPDVPAVYFCYPTDENIERISKDISNSLYSSYHFNFISPISRQKLEILASTAIKANATSQIEKLYDQYLNFICLENDMFTLRHQDSDSLSFYALNKSEMSDVEMDSILSQIVDGLFAVCVTLGTVPIIRCPRGNAAEEVGKRLDKKIRENYRDARNSLFISDGIQAGQYSFFRPLLVILDRHIDLATSLHHTWTYQALAHDVLNYSLNRVTVVEENSSGKSSSKNFNLDGNDEFWMNHKASPFPQVAENIQEELESYRAKEDDIKRMKHEMGLDDTYGTNGSLEGGITITDNTQRLTSAVSSLPQLLERKRLLDMHTSLATCILNQIKARKLDVYFELEEKIMVGQNIDKSVLDIINDEEAGTPMDKMRLFLIMYLSSSTFTEIELKQYTEALESIGCDIAPLRYIQHWLAVSRKCSPSALSSIAADTESKSSGSTTKTISMFSKLMAKSSAFVMEGVKNLVVKRHNLPVTKIVQELSEIRPGTAQDEFCYFDPKVLRGGDSNIHRISQPFQDSIVFVVGGGNYIEYQNLMEYVNSRNASGNPNIISSSASASNLYAMNTSSSVKHRIIYGTSGIVNANNLMQQLAKLGHSM